jgi:hypothetical protein
MYDAPTLADDQSALGQLLARVEDPEARNFAISGHGLLIDGEWRQPCSGNSIEVVEPSTGEAMGLIAAGDAADVCLAVESAARAFDDGRWSRLAPAEREVRLHRLADLMEREADLLATLETSTCPMRSAACVTRPGGRRKSTGAAWPFPPRAHRWR